MHPKFLFIHVMQFRNNFRVVFSDSLGKIHFSKSSGLIGLFNIKKRSLDTLFKLIRLGFLRIIEVFNHYMPFLLKFTGLRRASMTEVNSFISKLLKGNTKLLLGYFVINQTAFNGCRHVKKQND